MARPQPFTSTDTQPSAMLLRMIIQCPSCFTKFSIDAERLSGISQPRFHCSRCEHFFDLSEKANAAAPEPRAPEAAPVIEEPEEGPQQLSIFQEDRRDQEDSGYEEEEEEDFEEIEEEEEEEDEELEEEEELEASPPPPRREPLPPEPEEDEIAPRGKEFFRDTFSLVTAEWPAPDMSRPVEVDYRSALRPREEPPPSPRLRNEFIPRKEQTPRTETLRTETPRREPVLARPPRPEVMPPAPRPQSPLAARFTEPLNHRFPREDMQPESDIKLHFSPQFEKLGRAFQVPKLMPNIELSSLLPRLPGGMLVLLLILAVPIGTTAWLWRTSQRGTGFLFNLSSNDLPRLPPIGLEIVDVRPGYVTLDSGDRVVEVRGRLINVSAEAYRDIVVEAGMFDEQNQRILTQRLPLRNSLRESTKIGAMTPESIDALQRNARPDPHPVKPDSEEPVRLVLPVAKGAAWIGARIYSVRRG